MIFVHPFEDEKRNRLTKIEHKDGAAVLDSFAYVLDDVGNVESVTQVGLTNLQSDEICMYRAHNLETAFFDDDAP